jgi:hypothetical protein
MVFMYQGWDGLLTYATIMLLFSGQFSHIPGAAVGSRMTAML